MCIRDRKKEAQESYSHQAGGNNSVTESLQKEKVLKARDIAGQAAGHFIGKISGGKPPFFSVQMDMSVSDTHLDVYKRQ